MQTVDPDEFIGIDWDGPLVVNEDLQLVLVDPPGQPLNNSDLEELHATIDPLQPSNDYGIDIFMQTLNFIKRKLNCCY